MFPPPPLSRSLLDALEQRWRDQRAPLAAGLRPGLDDAQLDALTARIGLRLPPEAREWWRWHNGVDPSVRDWCMLGDGNSFVSLERAIERTVDERGAYLMGAADVPWGEQAAGEPWNDPQWAPGLLTFCEDTGGGQLVIDCAQPGPLSTVYYLDDEDRAGATRPRMPSLGQLVAHWIAALDDGALGYDAAAGRWRYDWDAMDPALQRSGAF